MTIEGKQTRGGPRHARPPLDRVPRGEQLKNELSSISALVDRLESAASSLPYVSKDGSSDCPFAENCYVEKAELEAKVSGKINCLADYLLQLDPEVQRCQERLNKIQADHAKLNRQEPQGHYSEAIRRAQERCQRAQDDRDTVSVTLTKARAVLTMSRGRVFPGKKPQRHHPGAVGTPGDVVGGPRKAVFPPLATQADGEIGGLISLGPLGPVSPPR